MLGRTEIDRCRFGGIEVINDEIEVHLLWPLLGRPQRRRVARHMMEGDALALLTADRSPVGGDIDLPSQQLAVEPSEHAGIRAVDHDQRQASDGHATNGIEACGRRRREVSTDVPTLLSAMRPLMPRLERDCECECETRAMDAMDEQPATCDVGESMASALTSARRKIKATRRQITIEDVENIVRSGMDVMGLLRRGDW